MSPPPAAILTGLTALVSLGYVTFGAGILRRYDGIGVRSLAAFAVVWGCNFLLNSAVIAIIVANGITSGADLPSLTVSRPVELFLVSTTPLSGLLTVVAIFGWLWFVLSYTTRLDRSDKLGILALGAFVFLITVLNGLVGALSSFGYISPSPSLESQFHRFASTVEVLGTGVAVGAGAAQLYRSARRHPPFAREAFVGLTLPVLLPYLARYVYQFGLILDFATVELLRSGSLLVGLAGLYVAVSRYDVFEQLPASQTVGRETAFGTTETPVVLLDAEDRVADLNPAACSLFGVTSAEVVGGPVEALLPATVDADAFRDAGRITFQFPHSDRVVESETTVTVGDGGREIGRTIVCNDITEERRRQQRIQVLNRALRHNLRNDLTAARGYVEMLTEAGDEAESHATRVLGILDGMADLGVKARDIEQVLAADADVDEPVSLAAIVEQAVEDARSAHGDASITTAVPDDVRVAVDPVVLRSVLRELLENAAVHTDGTGIEVAFVDAEGDIVVSDDGPGIPEYETEVFEIEEETSLKHGSGLGLWLVKWGVDRFGGTVRFDTSGTGTRVHVSIPDNLLARRAPAAD